MTFFGADCISIGQSSTSEKNRQVRQVHPIYLDARFGLDAAIKTQGRKSGVFVGSRCFLTSSKEQNAPTSEIKNTFTLNLLRSDVLFEIGYGASSEQLFVHLLVLDVWMGITGQSSDLRVSYRLSNRCLISPAKF